MTIAVFAKHLQAWPLEVCCERVRAAGFDGLDLTVRPGGYVQPGPTLAADLRRAVETVRSFGLSVPLITTGLTAADGIAEATLNAAGALGIREAKLHYWSWDATRSLAETLDAARRDLAGLAKIAEAAGVRLNLHNHSDFYATHAAHAVRRLLDDHPPGVVGAYVDPAHFTLEGGLAGWRSSLERLSDRISLLAVKDFRWIDVDADRVARQERRWVPVGTGNVPWTDVAQLLRRAGFGGAISVHGEYQGRWSWKDLSAEEVLRQCTADRQRVAAWFGESK